MIARGTYASVRIGRMEDLALAPHGCDGPVKSLAEDYLQMNVRIKRVSTHLEVQKTQIKELEKDSQELKAAQLAQDAKIADVAAKIKILQACAGPFALIVGRSIVDRLEYMFIKVVKDSKHATFKNVLPFYAARFKLATKSVPPPDLGSTSLFTEKELDQVKFRVSCFFDGVDENEKVHAAKIDALYQLIELKDACRGCASRHVITENDIAKAINSEFYEKEPVRSEYYSEIAYKLTLEDYNESKREWPRILELLQIASVIGRECRVVSKTIEKR